MKIVNSKCMNSWMCWMGLHLPTNFNKYIVGKVVRLLFIIIVRALQNSTRGRFQLQLKHHHPDLFLKRSFRLCCNFGQHHYYIYSHSIQILYDVVGMEVLKSCWCFHRESYSLFWVQKVNFLWSTSFRHKLSFLLEPTTTVLKMMHHHTTTILFLRHTAVA